ATPCETLCESVNLIIVASRKCQQFCGEVLEPGSLFRKSNRAACEKIGLRDDARPLIGLWLVRGHVDRLFAQALDEATTDRRILDKQRGPAVTFLDLHDLALEGPKREPPANDLENVKDLLSSQQNDTSGVVASFGFAQRDVPAHYEYVARLVANGVIGCQPLPLDDRAARRNRVLLVLGREGDWSHLTLEFQQYLGGLVLRMKKLAFKSL